MIFLLFTACGGKTAPEPVLTPRPEPPEPAIAYRVRGAAGGPGSVEVEACTTGFSTRRFSLLTGDGIEEAYRGGRRLIVEGGRAIPVDSGAGESCVTYRVRVADGVRPGLVNEGALLVRPEGAPAATTASVVLEESAGGFVTPYEESEGRLRPLASFLERSTTWARVGEGTVEVVQVAGVEMRLAILPGRLRVSNDALRRHCMRALELAVGLAPERYPSRLLVAVAPSQARSGDSPIVFGLARRGGGASVLFVLDEDATERALASEDWVAVHELSHFAFPAMPRSDAWLTEGWATYFQEVLRARGGMIEQREAFRRLHRGFLLGRDAGTGRPLHRESREMFETYAFKRVYWAGAARALEDDVHLRGRGESLESALARAFEGATFDTWVGFDDYVARLERIGHEELAAHARATRESTGFPDVSDAYAALGLRADGRSLDFDDDGARVSARRVLVSGDL